MKKITLLISFIFITFSISAQVYLNRTTPITSSEVFGITREISGGILSNKYGGMYIETKGSASGKPFYGFALDGNVKAYQYFDGVDNGVHMYNGKKLMSLWQDSLSYDLEDGVRLFYDGSKLEFGKNGNTYIGKGVTPFDNSTNIGNTITGWLSARKMTSGVGNTVYGFRNSEELVSGDWNTIIGSEAANKLISGVRNTMIGFRAGWNTSTSSSGNVFIGNRAGEGRNVSNKLVISNTETTEALIEGDFSTKELLINGNSKIEGQLDVTKQLISQDIKINDSNPYLEFLQLGTSKYYIQYQNSQDRLAIVDSQQGTVMYFKDDKIYFPQLSNGETNILIVDELTGELKFKEHPDEFIYTGFEFTQHFHTDLHNYKYLPITKELYSGLIISKLSAHFIWIHNDSSPKPLYLKRDHVQSLATETIATINPPSGNYSQELTVTFAPHTVDTDNYNYYLSTEGNSNFLRRVKIE